MRRQEMEAAYIYNKGGEGAECARHSGVEFEGVEDNGVV